MGSGLKPQWLRIRPPTTEQYRRIRLLVGNLKLHTVCEESHCPNMAECWSSGTATFMVLGDICTRGCRFCNVKTSFKGSNIDEEEPKKLLEAVRAMNLDYAVITSVDRDDLEDQGSNHFAKCIREVKKEAIVEVLIPDFRGDEGCIRRIVEERPAVIAHNIETVKRLQRKARDFRAGYEQSLNVLRKVKELDKNIFTKSSIIVGFGESKEEVIETMKDLRKIDVDVLTIGQYLQPSEKYLKVEEYINPETFNEYKKIGESLGFKYVASGPFVRSSYKAGELFVKGVLNESYS